MTNQAERNDKIIKFCSTQTSFKEAAEIADFLNQNYDRLETENLPTDDLSEKWGIWETVQNCLSSPSMYGLDKFKLDLIESNLGTQIALKIYQIYLKERLKQGDPPHYVIGEKELISKMENANFNKKQCNNLLTLYQKVTKIDKKPPILMKLIQVIDVKQFIRLSGLKPHSILYAKANNAGISINLREQDISFIIGSFLGLQLGIDSASGEAFLTIDPENEEELKTLNHRLNLAIENVCEGCTIQKK